MRESPRAGRPLWHAGGKDDMSLIAPWPRVFTGSVIGQWSCVFNKGHMTPVGRLPVLALFFLYLPVRPPCDSIHCCVCVCCVCVCVCVCVCRSVGTFGPAQSSPSKRRSFVRFLLPSRTRVFRSASVCVVCVPLCVSRPRSNLVVGPAARWVPLAYQKR